MVQDVRVGRRDKVKSRHTVQWRNFFYFLLILSAWRPSISISGVNLLFREDVGDGNIVSSSSLWLLPAASPVASLCERFSSSVYTFYFFLIYWLRLWLSRLLLSAPRWCHLFFCYPKQRMREVYLLLQQHPKIPPTMVAFQARTQIFVNKNCGWGI